MKIHQITPKSPDFPTILKTISGVPKQLFYLGAAPAEILATASVAIVGSRKVSSYGQRATEELARDLAERGIVIISGLALGVDTIAHRSAVTAGGRTIAVLPSGLDQIYPSSNRQLAQKIIDTGGCLISEYPEGTEPFQSNFVARNRIVSGLAQALIITEAAENSGSLHTAKFALDQGREVGAVPGSIYSQTSVGCNKLIKTGAMPITSVNDVLNAIGLADKPKVKSEIIASNKEEYVVMTLINTGVSDGEQLLKASGLETAVFNQTLTMLEIGGKIKSAGNGQWFLS
ncbi:MAG: DNA-processing protein DprA [Candidatus Saccharimonadales bacterium]